jgi:hypothetical protein
MYEWCQQHRVKILCLGMDFTSPVTAPVKSDDVRLRMLGYICPGAEIKSVGQHPSESALHRKSDLRIFPSNIQEYAAKLGQIHAHVRTRNTSRESWFFDAMHSNIVLMDYYWLPTSYFERGSNQNGYGVTWFDQKGQVINLLTPGLSAVRAILLPNFISLTQLYRAGEAALTANNISMALLSEAQAQRFHPLVVATVKAQKLTNWLSSALPKGARADTYHRTDDVSGREFMRFDHTVAPFMLLYNNRVDNFESITQYIVDKIRPDMR